MLCLLSPGRSTLPRQQDALLADLLAGLRPSGWSVPILQSYFPDCSAPLGRQCPPGLSTLSCLLVTVLATCALSTCQCLSGYLLPPLTRTGPLPPARSAIVPPRTEGNLMTRMAENPVGRGRPEVCRELGTQSVRESTK